MKIKSWLNNTSKDNLMIIRNMMGSFIVKGGSLVLTLLTMPVYIHLFHNQESLGIWYTLLAVLNWILTFDLGLGNGLRNKIPQCIVNEDYESLKKYISATYIGTFLLVCVWSIIGYIFIPYIDWCSLLNIHSNIISKQGLTTAIVIVFVGIMIQFMLRIVNSILYAFQKSAVVNFLAFIISLFSLLLVSVTPSGSGDENLIRMAIINVVSANLPYLVVTIFLFATKLRHAIPSFKYFSMKYMKEVLSIGIAILWLQLVFMIISSTNEFLITKLTSPVHVVEFQAYYKIFNTVSTLFALALVPIWSAVTKASEELRYGWIIKINKLFLAISIVVLMIEICIIPFMQKIVNLWLGVNYIKVNLTYALIFAISSAIFFLHNVNTSMGNGISYFKIQLIWMTFAAMINIPVAIIFVKILNSWIGVILANVVSLLPFEILEIIYFDRYVKRLKDNNCVDT